MQALCGALGVHMIALLHPSQAVATAVATAAPERSIDIYVAAAMASLGEKYAEGRALALDALEVLRSRHPDAQFYCTLESRLAPDDFEDESLALSDNLDALRRSRALLAILLQPLVTSVLVEIGAALAIGVPTVVIVRRKEDLPFLLRGSSLRYPFQVHRIAGNAALAHAVSASASFILQETVESRRHATLLPNEDRP